MITELWVYQPGSDDLFHSPQTNTTFLGYFSPCTCRDQPTHKRKQTCPWPNPGQRSRGHSLLSRWGIYCKGFVFTGSSNSLPSQHIFLGDLGSVLPTKSFYSPKSDNFKLSPPNPKMLTVILQILKTFDRYFAEFCLLLDFAYILFLNFI